MTALAYDGRLIAIDSQTTQGDRKDFLRKAWEVSTPDGEDLVVFGAGTVEDILRCVDAMRAGTRLPPGDYHLLVVGLQETPVEFCGDDTARRVTDGPWAGGSGAHAALGALLMGADAAHAVKVACEIDLYSGGPVVVYDTKTRRFRGKGR